MRYDIYAFEAEGDPGFLKFGGSKEGWRARFRDQQPCNPRQLRMSGAWTIQDSQLPNGPGYRPIEAAFRSLHPTAPGGGPRREWFEANSDDAQAFMAKVERDNSFRSRFSIPDIISVQSLMLPSSRTLASKDFREDLNPGTKGGLWKLRLYLIGEKRSDRYAKVAATAYGRGEIDKAYHTGNRFEPAAIQRWLANANSAVEVALSRLQAALNQYHVHFGWYDLAPAKVMDAIVKICPELKPEEFNTDPRTDQGRLAAR